MAKKKELDKESLELKKEWEEKKIVVGTKSILKDLKNDRLSKVYLASNCPGKIKGDIEYYSRLMKVPVVLLKINNEEVGIFCKKHFFISVLGVRK